MRATNADLCQLIRKDARDAIDCDGRYRTTTGVQACPLRFDVPWRPALSVWPLQPA